VNTAIDVDSQLILDVAMFGTAVKRSNRCVQSSIVKEHGLSDNVFIIDGHGYLIIHFDQN